MALRRRCAKKKGPRIRDRARAARPAAGRVSRSEVGGARRSDSKSFARKNTQIYRASDRGRVPTCAELGITPGNRPAQKISGLERVWGAKTGRKGAKMPLFHDFPPISGKNEGIPPPNLPGTVLAAQHPVFPRSWCAPGHRGPFRVFQRSPGREPGPEKNKTPNKVRFALNGVQQLSGVE
jgi:hypothetical protein